MVEPSRVYVLWLLVPAMGHLSGFKRIKAKYVASQTVRKSDCHRSDVLEYNSQPGPSQTQGFWL